MRPGDPAWLPSDTIAALEWQADQDTYCSGCGQNLAESMKIENSFAYRAEALSCHGCQAVTRAARKLDDQTRQSSPRFRVWLETARTNGSGS